MGCDVGGVLPIAVLCLPRGYMRLPIGLFFDADCAVLAIHEPFSGFANHTSMSTRETRLLARAVGRFS